MYRKKSKKYPLALSHQLFVCIRRALVLLVLLLGWSIPAGADPESAQVETATQTDTQIGITNAPFFSLDDVSLSDIHGKGIEGAKLSPNDQIGVILWDEAGQGAKRVNTTDTVTTGQRNIQRTTVNAYKYQ